MYVEKSAVLSIYFSVKIGVAEKNDQLLFLNA